VTDRIRSATEADVDAVTALASAKRRQYSGYQPVYWAPAPDAEKLHRPYLAKLIDNEDVITLVSESVGAVTGAGTQLLRAAIDQARDRGAVQVVVVTGHLDLEKREALRACGLSIASEWWVTPALTTKSERGVQGIPGHTSAQP
jgi:hypothetical protein